MIHEYSADSTSSSQFSSSSHGSVNGRGAQLTFKEQASHTVWEGDSSSSGSAVAVGAGQATHSSAVESAEASKGSSNKKGPWRAHKSDVENPEYGWSQGAEKHDGGKCNPCMALITASGCKSGEDCLYCHLDHDDEYKQKRRRPCKSTRKRCKNLVDKINEQYKDDPEGRREAMELLVGKSPYLRSIALASLGDSDGEKPSLQEETQGEKPALQEDVGKSEGYPKPTQAAFSGDPADTTDQLPRVKMSL